jgi:ribose transport system permease protein
MSVVTPPEEAVVDTEEPQPSLIKRITSLQSVWILGVLVVIVAFFSITAGERFFSTSNFSLISQNIAVWAVLGVGMTFVIITSGIDLSVGSVLVFSSVVSALVMQRIGGDGWGTAAIGILAALVTGVLWGLLNGVLVANAKIPPLIHRHTVSAGGNDRLQHLHQDPRHSIATVRRTRRSDHRRNHLA